MDWLRSEDLKEEKVLTTSKLTITRQGSIYLSQIDLVTVSAGPSLTPVMLDSGPTSEMLRYCGESG